MNEILKVKKLFVEFKNTKGTVHAVNDLTFHLNRRETLGISGESGCGKTVTCRAILRLNRGDEARGKILFDGQDILKLSEHEMQKIRGSRISMIFQNPASSLNPVVKIGTQMVEVIRYHHHISKQEAKDIAIALLTDMGIPSPVQKLDEYPHEQSGGTNQRIMIAMALSCNPDILIADEPTASLDATVQNQVLQILRQLKKERDMGIIFVTHNLGLIHGIADKVLIMYLGMLMEEGYTGEIFANPLHPYTKVLLSSVLLYGAHKSVLKGEPPSASIFIEGCPFASRCPEIIGNVCLDILPPVININDKHSARCHLYNKIKKQ
ncbi:MAG: ABC transporter ATP-binding protein [Dehalococcoidia bacterium]|nr:ABC transporter ATP-binding protein [Dehalococcoidia bacterium]